MLKQAAFENFSFRLSIIKGASALLFYSKHFTSAEIKAPFIIQHGFRSSNKGTAMGRPVLIFENET